MGRIRTAVVGVGALGKHHLSWLTRIEQSNLVGFYDIDAGKHERYIEQHPGIKAYSSLEELAEQVDAVSIVVPTTAHYETASFLIDRGIHCLIEKPVTSTYDEAAKLQAKATKTGVKVTVGHIERFNPAVRAVRAESPQPVFVEAHRLAAFSPRGTDVAVIRDLMIHDIDLVLSFVQSEIVDIQASAVAVVSEQADIANARLTFANGAVANLTASRISLHQMRKIRIFQQAGYYSLDLATKQADLYRLADPDTEIAGMRIPLGDSGRNLIYSKHSDDGADMLQMELIAFLEAIANNKPVAVTLEEATEALRVALEVERIGQEALEHLLGRMQSG